VYSQLKPGSGGWLHPPAFCLVLAVAYPAEASRVVSLNLCTDELLTLLAPDSVVALSPLARDPTLSVVSDRAASLPWVRADAEAVLRLHPDLVLAGEYGAQSVLAALRGRGVRVVQVAEPVDFPGVAAEVTHVAGVLGVPALGARMVAAMWARLAAVKQRAPGRAERRAMLWQARGFTAGPGSFGDAVLRAAGLINAGTGGAVGLEAMLTHPPDVLVTETDPATPSLATDMLDHPAVAHVRRLVLRPSWLACPGPWSVEAVASLAGGV
jgi:iron complex transport system substrate-binding protein